ncbi:DUF3299 domain-containing protein [Vibrio sp. Isolate30]|uniref:DUF3299 domain-containing protein n=1 Tax=Vibrio sp. Isolate30 TaxID=2908536 RepID=UPI001EFC63AB|nr:DUF3299 domain-containing protein [Vibrio sp. Isolate30]
MKAWMSSLVGFALLVSNIANGSSQTTELSWEQLIPMKAEFDDPYATLTADQLYDLSVVAAFRKQQTSETPPSPQATKQYQETMDALQQQGVPVDELLSKRAEISAKRKQIASMLDYSLDQKQVKIPGYLLPLDFKGELTTEFFLVPTVGACIHVPPPPPNQMVLVKFPQGFDSSGLYPPVWVEGHIEVGKGQSQLYLTDGQDDITFGYSIDASSVKHYQ